MSCTRSRKLIGGAREAVAGSWTIETPNDRHRRNNIRVHLVQMRKAQGSEIPNPHHR